MLSPLADSSVNQTKPALTRVQRPTLALTVFMHLDLELLLFDFTIN